MRERCRRSTRSTVRGQGKPCAWASLGVLTATESEFTPLQFDSSCRLIPHLKKAGRDPMGFKRERVSVRPAWRRQGSRWSGKRDPVAVVDAADMERAHSTAGRRPAPRYRSQSGVCHLKLRRGKGIMISLKQFAPALTTASSFSSTCLSFLLSTGVAPARKPCCAGSVRRVFCSPMPSFR